MLSDFQKFYVLRRKQIGNNKDADIDWINSPKNIQRCRILGKEPLLLVEELRMWYASEKPKSL